jgi:hypothetical protein
MYFNDHTPPHFHAEYGEYEAVYIIDTLDTMRGHSPQRAHSLVVEWALAHRAELRAKRKSTLSHIFTVQSLSRFEWIR